jgi:hypothetical protein
MRIRGDRRAPHPQLSTAGIVPRNYLNRIVAGWGGPYPNLFSVNTTVINLPVPLSFYNAESKGTGRVMFT